MLALSRPRSTIRLNLSPRNGRTPSRKDGRSATLVGNRERRIKFASVAQPSERFVETGGEQEVAVRSEKRQESGGVSIGNRGGREHRGSSIPLRSCHLRFLFRSYRRFLCLRASPCTSLIHTISRSAWCSSAYLPASSVSELSSPSPTAFPRPPRQRPCSSLVHRPSSVLHKDQSIKNAALHEINPVAVPPPPSSFRSFLRVLLHRASPFPTFSFSSYSYSSSRISAVFFSSTLLTLDSSLLHEKEKERKREREREREIDSIRAITAAGTRSSGGVAPLDTRARRSSNPLRRLFFSARGHEAFAASEITYYTPV